MAVHCLIEDFHQFFRGLLVVLEDPLRLFECIGTTNRRFVEFAAKIRPLILTQENELLVEAPWGPHP